MGRRVGGRHTVPTLVFEGGYPQALVLKSLLEADGIEVTLDERFARGLGQRPRLYVAREDEADARRLIAAAPES
jgi:hypothetical protein